MCLQCVCCSVNMAFFSWIGPLHDPVTWYKITLAGAQVAQRDFQNKGRFRWTGTSCTVLEVPLCNLHTSMCDFVSCDRIVQRAYYSSLAVLGIPSLFPLFFSSFFFPLSYLAQVWWVPEGGLPRGGLWLGCGLGRPVGCSSALGCDCGCSPPAS